MPSPWIRDLIQRGHGPVPVRLSADYYVEFPVEFVGPAGPGYLSASSLDLSAELVSELVTWQGWFDEHTDLRHEPIEVGGPPEWAAWREQGTRLTLRLQHELGPDFAVRPFLDTAD